MQDMHTVESDDESDDDKLSDEDDEGLRPAKKRPGTGAKQSQRGVNRKLCRQVRCLRTQLHAETCVAS